jgi:hypothetical protein
MQTISTRTKIAIKVAACLATGSIAADAFNQDFLAQHLATNRIARNRCNDLGG